MAELGVVEVGFGVALVFGEFVRGDAGVADRVEHLDLDVIIINGSAASGEIQVDAHHVGVVSSEIERHLLPTSAGGKRGRLYAVAAGSVMQPEHSLRRSSAIRPQRSGTRGACRRTKNCGPPGTHRYRAAICVLGIEPEGSKDKSTPGLKLADPSQNEKVEKNVDQVIDFVAVEAGTYEIRCAKLCGMGHGRMKGKLIVEQ